MSCQTMGLGLLVSWLWLLFLQGPLLELAALAWFTKATMLFLAFLFAHALTCLTISQTASLRKFLVNKPAFLNETLFVLFISLCFILGPSFYPSLPTVTPSLAVCCAIMAGFCSAPLFILWMEYYSSLALPQAATALAGSLCIASGVTIVVIYLPQWTSPLLLSFCLLGSSYFFARTTKQPATAAGTIALPLHDFLSTRLSVLIALLYLAGGSIFATITIEQEFPNFFYLSNFAYAGACLFSIYLLKRSSIPDLHCLFRPILPFIGIGFLLFPLLPSTLAWLPLVFLQIGVAFLDMYTWLLFATLAKNHLRPQAICAYGIGLITIFIVGSNFMSLLLDTLLTSLSFLNIVCLMAGIICLISTQLFYTSWVPPGIKINFTPAPTPPPAPVLEEASNQASLTRPNAPAFIPSPEEIHDCYHAASFNAYLTPREKQVLYLLARGYSYKAMAEKLYISNNTVKYHVKNIYQKFAVTNRPELIELLFGKNSPL